MSNSSKKLKSFKKGFQKDDDNSYQVFLVLEDKKWHCRICEYKHVPTGQLAGRGGIKGLKIGNNSRLGIEISSENRRCENCGGMKYHDKWTGKFVDAVPQKGMPKKFARRAKKLLGPEDVIENSARKSHELILDHKFPRKRWTSTSEAVQQDYNNMSDEDIKQKFQLLKVSAGQNHNLLKSRACETCFETGRRGTPFGIKFFHKGSDTWTLEDEFDPKGCEGCGWYDFALWRDKLNEKLDIDVRISLAVQ